MSFFGIVPDSMTQSLRASLGDLLAAAVSPAGGATVVEREAVALPRLLLEDVAENPSDSVVAGFPGENLERRRIGFCDKVAFLDTRETLDRRAVEAHPVLKRPLQLLIIR